MEKYQRLSLDERETIGQMLSQGKSPLPSSAKL